MSTSIIQNAEQTVPNRAVNGLETWVIPFIAALVLIYAFILPLYHLLKSSPPPTDYYKMERVYELLEKVRGWAMPEEQENFEK